LSGSVPTTQTSPEQQPLQFAALHLGAPATQVFAWQTWFVPAQLVHSAPFAPQAVVSFPPTQRFPMQQPLQVFGLQSLTS
jgi:hypothetical protein